MLRIISGSKREEVTECRRNVILINFLIEILIVYSSPNSTRVIKSIRMRWVRHIASMADVKYIQNVVHEISIKEA
jgi:hypothetical protein